MKSMKKDFSKFSDGVIGCAIEVHRELGPGLLESTYQQCLARELQINKFSFTMEHPVAVSYKGLHLDCGYRVDLFVENELVVELKSVEEIKPVHSAQILTYMKHLKVKYGLLVNFNSRLMKHGIRSFIL